MNIAHLKAKILDLAVRGKLTEQRPEEGSAEELLERIREEKQRLIAEGKLKKEKPLPEITEDEIPFDIPAGWKWVTGKDEILPNDNDTDTTFEEYRKKNKGTKGGTGPALITVPDDEKVLYLKLVRYDWAEYEPITVIKVKEPADGSTPIIEKGTTSPGTYPAAETGWEYKQDIYRFFG